MSVPAIPADAKSAKALLAKSVKDVSELPASGLLESIKQSVGPKATAEQKEGAAVMYKAIASALKGGAVPFLLPLLPDIIVLAGDKKSGEVREAAGKAAKALGKVVSEHGVGNLIPVLLERAEKTTKWQETEVCLKLLQTFSESAPDAVAKRMVDIVPVVSALMWSTKKEIKKASAKTMKKVCDSIDNIDLEPFIPALIEAITKPENVEDCVHALASTTFVSTVTSSALSVTVPVLDRGFKTGKVAAVRQTAVIVENMAKLVADPKEVYPFMPVLAPALKKASAEIADPECRERCNAAFKAVTAIGGKATEDAEAAAAKDAEDEAEHKRAIKIVWQDELVNAGVDAKLVKDASMECVLDYTAAVAYGLGKQSEFDQHEWMDELAPAFGAMKLSKGDAKLAKAIDLTLKEVERLTMEAGGEVFEEDETDTAEQLCDCRFSLAYGSKILLNSARLHLKRGRRYGIIAAKSAGKTTLLRSIANGQLEGFPTEADGLKSVFVEHDIQASQARLNVVGFVLATVQMEGLTEQMVKDTLTPIGFTDQMQNGPITSLSGGWKMKLALARAMLQKADILLLDEPTNHLDVVNVQWVVDYLTGDVCSNVTSLIVSHDTKFLDKTTTHIIHFSPQLKLDMYLGNISKFVERYPEAKAYFDLAAGQLEFQFPPPGALEGVKNRGKAVMQMIDVEFTYPGAPTPQLFEVNIRVALASRVACVGANGAGKSTMIKLLTGELKPSKGQVIRHPNLKFAYVAQHAFHHIESHLDKTPSEYVRWRFGQDGLDKEAETKSTMTITDEEKAAMAKPIEIVYEDDDGKRIKEKRVLEKLMGRRKEGKEYNYEIKWNGKSQDANTYMPRDELIDRGFKKLVDELDRRLLAMEGAYVRTLTQKNVREHYAKVGLEAELCDHTRISALSGGSKVKVVLGACLWPQPHIVILDEPTNYLDREALGALGRAINSFEGGVVLITHNQEFADFTCRETWTVANNRCNIHGTADWASYAQEAIELGLGQDVNTDAAGNTYELAAKKKPESLKPREKKQMIKLLKKKIRNDEEMAPFEQECADAFGVWEM